MHTVQHSPNGELGYKLKYSDDFSPLPRKVKKPSEDVVLKSLYKKANSSAGSKTLSYPGRCITTMMGCPTSVGLLTECVRTRKDVLA